MALGQLAFLDDPVLPESLVSLGRRHRGAIATHLLRLEAGDRMRRFGGPRGDEEIQQFVATLDFARDWFLGAQTLRLPLVDLAQARVYLTPSDLLVDVAISVDTAHRKHGMGRFLLETVASVVHSISGSSVVTLGGSARRNQNELRAEFGASDAGIAHEVVSSIRIRAERPPAHTMARTNRLYLAAARS